MDPAEVLVPGLATLQLQSSELGRAATTGAAGQVEKDEAKVDFLKLLRFREQLKHHNMEHQTMVLAGDASSDSYPDEMLTELIKELQEDIENEKVSHHNKTMVLQRMQFTDALLCKLQENNTESRLIRDTVKHITEISSLTLQVQQDNQKLEENLFEVKRKRLALKETACGLMTQIHALEKNRRIDLQEMESTKIQKTCKVLEKETNKTTVMQSIFQHLILGSHVNWADYPKLTDIVLKLEKNPNKL